MSSRFMFFPTATGDERCYGFPVKYCQHYQWHNQSMVFTFHSLTDLRLIF